MAWNPWTRPGEGPGDSWLDAWRSATSWWTQPVAPAGRALAEANLRLLGELADGLMRRFEGRRVEVLLGAARVEAVLESIRLRRVDGRYTGRLDLTDVLWHGLPIATLAAVARTVRLEPGAASMLVVEDIELVGSTPVEALLAEIEPWVDGWSLAVGADGRIEARGRRPGLVVVVEPVVEEHELELELREVRWAGVRLRIPYWLRLVRRMPVPGLVHGATITEARRRDGMIDFRLHVPSLTERFDPARVRDAVFTGGPVPFL
jgi:hypothetical protein